MRTILVNHRDDPEKSLEENRRDFYHALMDALQQRKERERVALEAGQKRIENIVK